ncbi:ATP-binding protein, partial [Kitasatospora sp. NPDC059747]|uniref:ATP-binding protein n=1 Tax=Kitasatospora sp. NPDC059747 TaxID=3346930 RepID=UPI003652C106
MGWNVIVSPLNTAGFPVPLEWGVPPGVDSVPPARRLVMAIVREWGVPLSPDDLQEVELCASELIANALLHTRSRCTVAIRWRAGRLRVEVIDRRPDLPRPERCTESTSGRGLLLVETLAAAWGWHPAGTGKVVWFEYLETSEVAGGAPRGGGRPGHRPPPPPRGGGHRRTTTHPH